MFRFFPQPDGRVLVTARRKPRGYLVYVKEVRKFYSIDSHYSGSVDWKEIVGWRPVGMNGRTTTRLFSTRRKAAEALVSMHHLFGS